MKKSILSAFLVSLLMMPSLGNAQQSSKYGNDAALQSRNLESFNAIDLSGGLDVYISQGTNQSVEVKASAKNQEKIITEVKNSKLHIYVEKGTKNLYDTEVYITVVNLQELEVSGACDVKGKTNFDTKDFKLSASGGSDVELSLNADNVTFAISGASDIDIEGSGNSVEMYISGASDFNAKNFKVKSCHLEVSGASDVSIHVSDELAAEISGASDVDYSGNPKITSRKVSGSGSLDPH